MSASPPRLHRPAQGLPAQPARRGGHLRVVHPRPSSPQDEPGPLDPVDPLAAARLVYWQRTRRWTLSLLLVWLVVTVVASFFARELNVMVAGWPLSFWVATQGALGVYVLIVAIYAYVMDRLDAALLAVGQPASD